MENYNPLEYIQEELRDEELLEVISKGGINHLCFALTLDLYNESLDKKLDT
jgi:glutamate/tyrosine decarboxylase-like PLP-dependent enzyme